jgi:hypothetical protein
VAVLADPPGEQIVRFLARIGIGVATAELGDDTFLPGILIERGRMLVDPRRLRYPGDLLHEAGHLAVLAPAVRASFGDGTAGPQIDMAKLEVMAIAWSYAAALELDLDPAVVLHDDGYRGQAEALRRTFALGVYFGIDDLEAAGMTLGLRRAAQLGVAPYPHMLRWLRE